MFCGAAFAKYDRVTGQYYDIYWGDIESLEHGLDGYQDILLKARPNYVPIGVGVNFPVPVDTGFEDILLCGSSSGTFSVCTLSPQATLPPDTAQGFDLLVGDFDADGDLDLFYASYQMPQHR